MYFQNIDDKKECVGVFFNNELVFEDIDLENFTRTWKYSELSLIHI